MGSIKGFLVAAVYLSCICLSNAQKVNKTTITGGEEINISSRPFQVSLQSDHFSQFPELIPYNHLCGGSILNDRWIITAAHCLTAAPSNDYPGLFYDGYADDLEVAVGITEQSQVGVEGQLIAIKNWYAHPEYGSPNSLSNDIALIELAEPISFNYKVQPVRVLPPDQTAYLQPDSLSYASGWGQTVASLEPTLQEKTSNHLLGVQVPFITSNKDNFISTGFEGLERKGPCHGDSGGPLTVEGDQGITYLAGAVSHGVGGCIGAPNSPTWYTNIVSYYENWVLPFSCLDEVIIRDSLYEDVLFEAMSRLEVMSSLKGAAKMELLAGTEVQLTPGFEFFAEEEGNLAVNIGGACASQDLQALIASVTYSRETTDQSADLFFHLQIEQASNNAEDLSLLLVPNPARDQVKVALTASATLRRIQLVSLSGQVLRTSHVVDATSITLPMQDILPGIYFVVATDEFGKNYAEKLSLVR